MGSPYAYDNICYKEIKNTENKVHCVTMGTLPFNMRTLSPKCHMITEDVTVLRDEKSYGGADQSANSRCKILCLLLLLTFLMTSSVTVYLVVFKFVPGMPENAEVNIKANGTSDQPNPSKLVMNKTDSEYKVYSTDRTLCARRCVPYAHPRFEASCESGFCVCSGSNYQRTTCLPMVDRCKIKKYIDDIYLDNQPVTGYTCHVTAPASTHVISVYGNHFSRETVVNLSSTRKDDTTTLVLASHYSVKWKLKCTGVDLKNIILVSDRHHGSPGVEMDCATNSLGIPSVSSVRIPFGYGDDRYGMDTVNMLKVIRNTFGEVKSFTGAEFADYINLKL